MVITQPVLQHTPDSCTKIALVGDALGLGDAPGKCQAAELAGLCTLAAGCDLVLHSTRPMCFGSAVTCRVQVADTMRQHVQLMAEKGDWCPSHL